jgi:hypothetical protein
MFQQVLLRWFALRAQADRMSALHHEKKHPRACGCFQ